MLKNLEAFCGSKNLAQCLQKWTSKWNFDKIRACFERRRTDEVQFVIPSATVHLARKCSRPCFQNLKPSLSRTSLSLLLGPVPRRMPIMVSRAASGSSSGGVSANDSEDDLDYLYELDIQNEDINDEDGGDGGSDDDDFHEMVLEEDYQDYIADHDEYKNDLADEAGL